MPSELAVEKVVGQLTMVSSGPVVGLTVVHYPVKDLVEPDVTLAVSASGSPVGTLPDGDIEEERKKAKVEIQVVLPEDKHTSHPADVLLFSYLNINKTPLTN